VFPGNYHTVHALEPAILASEIALDLAPAQRRRTIWRLDGGSGSEQELRWIVERGYHILAKGINYNRAAVLAKRVKRWDKFGDVWLGEAPPPGDYARPVRVLVKRQIRAGAYHHSYYVTTLPFSSKSLLQSIYNARGGAEVEQFRNDKSGLGLEARRKRSYLGQKAYILLTDLAHNLLADFRHRSLAGSRFAEYGPQRILRDLLEIPEKLVFEDGRLRRIELLSLKQNSPDLLICLERYCSDP
jgi:Transposase DDE domain group 1